MRILLADDDSFSHMILRAIVKKLGGELSVARDGHEAVEKYKTEEFDFILMDVEMPNCNGLAATEIIRAYEKDKGKHIIIVGLTGHTQEEEKKKCLQVGMDICWSKPVGIQELRQLIEKCHD